MAKLKVPVGPDDHAQGPADAPFTLLEYGDYECPHGGHAYPIVKALQKRFGKQLRFDFEISRSEKYTPMLRSLPKPLSLLQHTTSSGTCMT
jgi:hypothetical protein